MQALLLRGQDGAAFDQIGVGSMTHSLLRAAEVVLGNLACTQPRPALEEVAERFYRLCVGRAGGRGSVQMVHVTLGREEGFRHAAEMPKPGSPGSSRD